MTDKEFRNRLVQPNDNLPNEASEVVEVVSDINTEFYRLAVNVIASYQNATKWLDTIKEELIMSHGCAFFGNYIHTLAHAMPERFDEFGKILHLYGMKVPYPTTEALENIPESMNSLFDLILQTLSAITLSLSEFIHKSAGTPYHSAAVSAEELLVEIQRDITYVSYMHRSYNLSGDNLRFDLWVKDYAKCLGVLLD